MFFLYFLAVTLLIYLHNIDEKQRMISILSPRKIKQTKKTNILRKKYSEQQKAGVWSIHFVFIFVTIFGPVYSFPYTSDPPGVSTS